MIQDKEFLLQLDKVREKEIYAWRTAELNRAMMTLARSEIFRHLWD